MSDSSDPKPPPRIRPFSDLLPPKAQADQQSVIVPADDEHAAPNGSTGTNEFSRMTKGPGVDQTTEAEVTKDDILSLLFRIVAVTISLSQTTEALAAGDLNDAQKTNRRIAEELDELVNEAATLAGRIAVDQR